MSTEQIPIQNIYFLLCYAWNHLQEKDYASARSEGCDKLWDLLAKVLIRSTQQLVKRGLHRNYVTHQELLVRPKGRILFSEEIRRPHYGRLAKACEFDELDPDILANQIIHASLRLLRRHPGLSAENQRELQEILPFWQSFASPVLTSRLFRRVAVHRNMRHYRFTLNICELIYEQCIPTEEDGDYRFRDFLRDEAQMGLLFQQFVRNFLAAEQTEFLVSAPQVKWNLDPQGSTPRGLSLLPTMNTDIALESADVRMIIDCKFYLQAFQKHFDTTKFISGHLYQLFAYLKNQEIKAGWEDARGMLLYPAVDAPFDETVSIYGHKIRVVSIDLGQDWQRVSGDLKALLGPSKPVSFGKQVACSLD